MSNADELSKDGNHVASVVVLEEGDTRSNNPFDLALAHHLVPVSKEVASEEGLAVEGVASEVVSAVIEEEGSVIEEGGSAIEEGVSVIVVALVGEVELGTKVEAALEDEVGMRMELHHPMRQADQEVDVVGMAVHSRMVPLLIMATVAAMGTPIETAFVVAVPAEAPGMTIETHAARPEVIANLSSVVAIEGMVEIEIATGTGKEIVIGMAADQADEMTITARGKGTTKVMGMMTREAKEGIERPNVTQLYPFSNCSAKSTTVCWWVPTTSLPRFSRLHLFSSLPPYFSAEGKKGIGEEKKTSQLGLGHERLVPSAGRKHSPLWFLQLPSPLGRILSASCNSTLLSSCFTRLLLHALLRQLICSAFG
jgi:hypothetical protein